MTLMYDTGCFDNAYNFTRLGSYILSAVIMVRSRYRSNRRSELSMTLLVVNE